MIRNEKGSEGNTIWEQGSAHVGEENEKTTANEMSKTISKVSNNATTKKANT